MHTQPISGRYCAYLDKSNYYILTISEEENTFELIYQNSYTNLKDIKGECSIDGDTIFLYIPQSENPGKVLTFGSVYGKTIIFIKQKQTLWSSFFGVKLKRL